jgi:hypothetical protein
MIVDDVLVKSFKLVSDAPLVFVSGPNPCQLVLTLCQTSISLVTGHDDNAGLFTADAASALASALASAASTSVALKRPDKRGGREDAVRTTTRRNGGGWDDS